MASVLKRWSPQNWRTFEKTKEKICKRQNLFTGLIRRSWYRKGVHLKRLKYRQPEENHIHFSSLADQQWSLENPLKVVDTLRIIWRTLREKCPSTEFFMVRIQSDCGKIRARKNSVFGHISHSGIIEYGYISAVVLNSTVQQPVTLRIGGLLVWIPWLCLAGLWDLTSLLYFRWPFVQIRNSEVIKIGWVRRRPHQWSKVDLQAAK